MADKFATADIVQAYLDERGVATKAAERLGCSERTVRGRLKTPEGQELLAEAANAVIKQYEVNAVRIVGEAAALAFSDLPRILRSAKTIDELNELEPHLRAAISELVVGEDGVIEKVRVHPKLPALQVLAEYVDLAGLGGTGMNDAIGSRPELGGLTIQGNTSEANHDDRPIDPGPAPGPEDPKHDQPARAVRRAIPQPRKLD